MSFIRQSSAEVSFLKKVPVLVLTLILACQLIVPPAYAQMLLQLPPPAQIVPLSGAFNPALMVGLTVHPENPFLFDFLIHPGDNGFEEAAFTAESTDLIKYFLSALTIPDDQGWVNLSPYDKDRVIPEALGQTLMGKTMLEQDYLLKQISSSLTNPNEELGQQFWQKVYQAAYERFGVSQVPVSTFNKVWIVPDQALVLEEDGSAFVAKSHLKVMLAEDYEALSQNMGSEDFGLDTMAEQQINDLSRVSSDVFKEVIVPKLEDEINQGENFAPLRQIYQSVILAVWYKQALKDSLLGQIYVNQEKIAGIDLEDKTVKDQVYAQYLKAFKKGAYSLIKEEYDLASQAQIPRKYFSGGLLTTGATAKNLQVARGVNNVPVQITRDVVEKATGAYTVSTLADEKAAAEAIAVVAADQVAAKKSSSDASLLAKTFLVVDEHPVWRDIAKKELEERGHTVILADGVSEGLQQIKENGDNIDVLLTGLQMEMGSRTGLEIVDEVNKNHPGIRAIIMSAADERDLDKIAKDKEGEILGVISKWHFPQDLNKNLDKLQAADGSMLAKGPAAEKVRELIFGGVVDEKLPPYTKTIMMQGRVANFLRYGKLSEDLLLALDQELADEIRALPDNASVMEDVRAGLEQIITKAKTAKDVLELIFRQADNGLWLSAEDRKQLVRDAVNWNNYIVNDKRFILDYDQVKRILALAKNPDTWEAERDALMEWTGRDALGKGNILRTKRDLLTEVVSTGYFRDLRTGGTALILYHSENGTVLRSLLSLGAKMSRDPYLDFETEGVKTIGFSETTTDMQTEAQETVYSFGIALGEDWTDQRKLNFQEKVKAWLLKEQKDARAELKAFSAVTKKGSSDGSMLASEMAKEILGLIVEPGYDKFSESLKSISLRRRAALFPSTIQGSADQLRNQYPELAWQLELLMKGSTGEAVWAPDKTVAELNRVAEAEIEKNVIDSQSSDDSMLTIAESVTDSVATEFGLDDKQRAMVQSYVDGIMTWYSSTSVRTFHPEHFAGHLAPIQRQAGRSEDGTEILYETVRIPREKLDPIKKMVEAELKKRGKDVDSTDRPLPGQTDAGYILSEIFDGIPGVLDRKSLEAVRARALLSAPRLQGLTRALGLNWMAKIFSDLQEEGGANNVKVEDMQRGLDVVSGIFQYGLGEYKERMAQKSAGLLYVMVFNEFAGEIGDKELAGIRESAAGLAPLISRNLKNLGPELEQGALAALLKDSGAAVDVEQLTKDRDAIKEKAEMDRAMMSEAEAADELLGILQGGMSELKTDASKRQALRSWSSVIAFRLKFLKDETLVGLIRGLPENLNDLGRVQTGLRKIVAGETTDRSMLVDEVLAQFSADDVGRLPASVVDNLKAGVVKNMDEVNIVKTLIQIGEQDLMSQWEQPGTNDDRKAGLLKQLINLDRGYPGGLVQYKKNGVEALRAFEAGEDPFEGFTPQPPQSEDLTKINEKFARVTQVGREGGNKIAAALVAGGVGSRLGFEGGAKVTIPLDIATMKTYIQHFIEGFLAIQNDSNVLNNEEFKIPFSIMTSDDTHDQTVEFLTDNDYFGMDGLTVLDPKTDQVIYDEGSQSLKVVNKDGTGEARDLNQIIIMKQDSVPAMKGYDGKFFLKDGDPYSIDVKPHNHGDIHVLMHLTGLAKALEDSGRTHTLFFQDTNGQVFNGVLPALGNAIEKKEKMSFVAVQREVGSNVGAVANMVHEDGRSLTFNYEYNLLKASGKDVADPATGFSPYGGNLNVFFLEQNEYVEKLSETGGIFGEIVNPKQDTLVSRLEAPMQDIAQYLKGSDVGVSIFDPRFVFAATKNGLQKALIAVAQGIYPEAMPATEGDYYKANRQKLARAGVDIDADGEERLAFPGTYEIPLEKDKPPVTVKGVPYTAGAIVSLPAKLALLQDTVNAVFQGGKISSDSVLTITGEGDVELIKDLDLDGTLRINVGKGVKLSIPSKGGDTVIRNEGEKIVDLTAEELADQNVPEILRMRGYRIEKSGDEMEINIQAPGLYELDREGKVIRLGDNPAFLQTDSAMVTATAIKDNVLYIITYVPQADETRITATDLITNQALAPISPVKGDQVDALKQHYQGKPADTARLDAFTAYWGDFKYENVFVPDYSVAPGRTRLTTYDNGVPKHDVFPDNTQPSLGATRVTVTDQFDNVIRVENVPGDQVQKAKDDYLAMRLRDSPSDPAMLSTQAKLAIAADVKTVTMETARMLNMRNLKEVVEAYDLRDINGERITVMPDEQDRVLDLVTSKILKGAVRTAELGDEQGQAAAQAVLDEILGGIVSMAKAAYMVRRPERWSALKDADLLEVETIVSAARAEMAASFEPAAAADHWRSRVNGIRNSLQQRLNDARNMKRDAAFKAKLLDIDSQIDKELALASRPEEVSIVELTTDWVLKVKKTDRGFFSELKGRSGEWEKVTSPEMLEMITDALAHGRSKGVSKEDRSMLSQAEAAREIDRLIFEPARAVEGLGEQQRVIFDRAKQESSRLQSLLSVLPVDEQRAMREVIAGSLQTMTLRTLQSNLAALAGSAQDTSGERLTAGKAPGGIDFNPEFLDLQIRRDGKGVPLPLPMQNLEQINIEGLYPVIINIAPASILDFPLLMGKLEEEERLQLSRK